MALNSDLEGVVALCQGPLLFLLISGVLLICWHCLLSSRPRWCHVFLRMTVDSQNSFSHWPRVLESRVDEWKELIIISSSACEMHHEEVSVTPLMVTNR